MVQLLWRTVCRFLNKLKQNYHIIKQTHLWIYAQKNLKQGLEEIFPHAGTQHHYLQQSRDGSSPVYTDEWINKMWYIHTMEYYSAPKMMESLSHATWMTLGDIMLCEISYKKTVYDCTCVKYLK